MYQGPIFILTVILTLQLFHISVDLLCLILDRVANRMGEPEIVYKESKNNLIHQNDSD